MLKFHSIKDKYLELGVSESNIDTAIDAVLDGTKRAFIIETLTADYRGLSETTSSQLLNDLFEANGGEFKHENRGGYLTGVLLLIVGLLGAGFFTAMLISGEATLKFMILSFSAALLALPGAIIVLIKSVKGKYRDSDDPFEKL